MTERMAFTADGKSIAFALGSKYLLESIEGLDSGELTREMTSYMDMDGAGIGDALYEPRMITVKGFICASDKHEMYCLRKQLTAVIDGKTPGILEYHGPTGRYRTEAVSESLPQWGQPTQHIWPFVVYFLAYHFYWQAYDESRHDILRTDKTLLFPFTFPGPFGVLTTRADVVNRGDVPAPCVIEVVGAAASTGVLAQSEEVGLDIINHTTGKHIFLAYDIAPEERVVIDTGVPSVESSLYGNILHKIAFDRDDTYQTDIGMQLVLGRNDIQCINHNPAHFIRATVRHYNQYVGV